MPQTALDLRPISAPERLVMIDVLRGFALLGILLINTEFFALPGAVYFDPRAAGGFDGLNLAAWYFTSIFALQKMMGIFSMLFGAGVIIMTERLRAAGGPVARVYYRRILWLLVFGMIHGYLVWYGDILYGYAVIGLYLYLFRNRSPRTLLIWALAFMLAGSLAQWGSGTSLGTLRHAVPRIEAAQAAGDELGPEEEWALEQWRQAEATFTPSSEQIAAEVEAYRGGYLENLSARVPKNVVMQTQGFVFFYLWRATAMMLLGMALYRLGVLAGRRSTRFYLIALLCGYGLGIPLCAYGAYGLSAHHFDFIYRFRIGNHFNYWGGPAVALGHISALVLLHRRGWLRGLWPRLAAVGRTAFSNYLFQSVLCTTLFYGFGFGLFDRLGRLALLGVTVVIWIAQLLIAPWWLKRFQFGPAEWLWRTLTYLRRQPLRIS